MSNDGGQKRADSNRDRALQLKRILATLIDRACTPGFTGQISLVFSVQGGYIKTPHAMTDEWFDRTD